MFYTIYIAYKPIVGYLRLNQKSYVMNMMNIIRKAGTYIMLLRKSCEQGPTVYFSLVDSGAKVIRQEVKTFFFYPDMI